MVTRSQARPPADSDPPALGGPIVARALSLLAAVVAALLVVPLVHNAVTGRQLAVLVIAGFEVAIGLALLLNHRGHTRPAALIFIGGAWGLAFLLAGFAGEGTRDVALFALGPILLGAGVLVNRRFLTGLTAASIATLGALWYAEGAGWVGTSAAGRLDLTGVFDAAVILIVTATATAVVTTNLRRTLHQEKRSAAALAQSELRLRTAIELAADGIVLADSRGVVTEANSVACAMLGRTRGAVVGSPIFELFPEDSCTQALPTRDQLDCGTVVRCEGTLARTGQGDVAVEAAWQRLPDGSIQCFLRDISARRRTEEHQRQARTMEAVAALAGGIAQDFNNLITVMKGFLELIEADPALSDELAGHVTELKQTSDHAANLTRQLLAFAGQAPLERRVWDVRDLLTKQLRHLAGVAGEGVKVIVEPLTTPCPVCVDTGLIAQALVTLVAQARERMPDGGRLALAAIAPSARSPARVGPEGFMVRDYTGIRILGTGRGASPGGSGAGAEPPRGSAEHARAAGLGLTLVHGIIERHGGWVESEDRPGGGTSMLLFLPVHAPPEVPVLAPAAAVEQPSARAGAILVVDDDAGMRRLAQHALTHAGYSVVEAESGPEALLAWDEHEGRIDLVFTDMVMPGGMNGLQLIDACRLRKPDLPAILTSGYSLPPLGQGPSADTADLVMLSKPYAHAVLVDTVRALVGRTGHTTRDASA